VSLQDENSGGLGAPGRVLRSIRAAKGWTLAEVKDLTGLSISTLSKLETGKIALTYDKLMKLGRALNVDMAQLLGESYKPIGETPRLLSGRRVVTRKGEERIVSTESYDYTFYAADLLNRSLHPMMLDIKVRSIEEIEEFTRHAGEEFTYVIEGAVEFHTELYAPTRLNAGDSVYFDAGMGHAYVAAAPGTCRVLSVCTSLLET
jgi:transcriptional regulator with XRE-family HTH domain